MAQVLDDARWREFVKRRIEVRTMESRCWFKIRGENRDR